MSRVILGIDPGISGAIARLTPHPDHDLEVWDLPTFTVARNGKNRRQLDIPEMLRILRDANASEVYLEAVGARPGESPVAAFSFGRGFGALEAAIAALGLPCTSVTPARWKKMMSVPAGKDGARMRASQVLPSGAGFWRRVKDDGRAEAALLAAYGLLYGGRS